MCHCIIIVVNVVTSLYAIIDHGISAPRHGREVVDGLNTTDKRFLFQLISTMQLMAAKGYSIQMGIYSGTPISGVILARNFKAV